MASGSSKALGNPHHVRKAAKLEDAQLTIAQRLELLSNFPLFQGLLRPELTELAGSLQQEYFAPGTRIVTEGGEAQRLFFIWQGSAEVTIASKNKAAPLILACLNRGEMFGEMAFFSPTRTRQATITALSPMITLALDATVLENLLEKFPFFRELMQASVEEMRIARFLKQVSPFSKLEPTDLRRLSPSLKKVRFVAGDVIIQQGEVGDGCYLIYSGQVEVLAQQERTVAEIGAVGEGQIEERRLSTLRAGALFGEAALLTAAPRNATVRATEPCELLFLASNDFLKTLASTHRVGFGLIELLQLRARPRAIEGITCQQQTLSDTETITILKDPKRHTYYRLSSQGWFIWQHLDGKRNLRDLTLDYLTEFKAFSPGFIAETVSGLVAAGFVESPVLQPEVARWLMFQPAWYKWLKRIGQLLTWRIGFEKVNKPLNRLYRAGLFVLYTRVAQVLLGLASLLGLLVFLVLVNKPAMSQGVPGEQIIWFLLPAYIVSIVLHEAGHAFTTIAFGREIPRAGFGWYWVTPVAYVDTTDMWLAGKWPRIAVSLAGPYMNFLLGSFSALAAWLVADPALNSVLRQFSLVSYLMVILNLNPLLDYDGYYALADWLEQPNLRQRSFKWLVSLSISVSLRIRVRKLKNGTLRQQGLNWCGKRAEKIYLTFLLLYGASWVLLFLLLFKG